MDHRSDTLEQALISIVVIQLFLEGVDRRCFYNVLRQGVPAVNNSLGKEKNLLELSLQCFLYNFRL